MSRISAVFQQHKKVFIPFITAGDGSLDTTLSLMHTLVDNGAGIIELGVPFSDPMADGSVIAKSHQRAVEAGVSLHHVLDLVRQFRATDNHTGVVLMGYLNPIEFFGYSDFATAAKKAGVDGVLIVDMPPEEADELKERLDAVEVDFIFLVAPTTTDVRLKSLAKIASGFVYFVSLKGVTGAKNLNTDLVNQNLVRIRQYIDLPVGVGFGIKDASTAKTISQQADAVIVGSVLVSLIEQYAHDKNTLISHMGALSYEIAQSIQ
jgi:tryptophan synthase alpha chain